jgi:predicted ATP-dependent Lon-type protease
MNDTTMKRLAGAILIQTLKDHKSDKYKEDIIVFIRNDWFEVLANTVGMDPNSIRNQIETSSYQKVSLRAAYR